LSISKQEKYKDPINPTLIVKDPPDYINPSYDEMESENKR